MNFIIEFINVNFLTGLAIGVVLTLSAILTYALCATAKDNEPEDYLYKN